MGNVDVDHQLSDAVVVDLPPGSEFSLERVGIVNAVTNTLHLRVMQAVDNATITITFSDQGRSGAVGVLVDVLANRLVVRSGPSVVTALEPFAVAVGHEDAEGNVDVDLRLSAATTAVALTPGFSAEIVGVASTFTLLVRVVRAVDNTTATITLDDQGLSVDASLLVRVVADRLAVRAPSTVTALVPFAVEAAHEDAAGNVDADIGGLSDAVGVVALSVGAEIVGGSVSTATVVTHAATSRTAAVTVVAELLWVTVSSSTDHAQVAFNVLDRGRVTSASVLVDVVGTEISASAPLVAMTGLPFLVDVGFLDANGNRDEDLHYLADAADTTLTVAVSALVEDISPTQRGPMITLQGGVVEGQLVDILLERQGFLPDSLSVVPEVLAVALSLGGPSTGTVGAVLTVAVHGVDQYGNIDSDYIELPSSSLSLSVRAGGQSTLPAASYHFAKGAPLSLWVNIYEFSDNTVAELSLGDGSLLSQAPLMVLMDVWADRLSVTGPGVLYTERSYRLNYVAVDTYGNTDADYSLAAADVSLGVSRNGDIALSADGVFEVIRAEDGATLAFTASDGHITGTYTAMVSVYASRLRATALSDVLVPGLGAGISVVGVDKYGNVGSGYSAPGSVISLEVVASTGSANVALAPTLLRYFLLLYVDNATDGAELAVRVYESGGLSEGGGVEPSNILYFTVDVVATRIAIDAPAVISPGTTAAISYQLRDHIGNVDTDAAPVSLIVGGFDGDYTLSRAGSTWTLAVTQAIDGATLRLSASDAGLSGVAEILVDVQADRLRLQLPGAAYIGEPFVFSLAAVDRYDNVDSAWRISSNVMLAPAAGSLFHFGPRAADGALAAVISDLPGSTELRVVATDGALSGADVISMRGAGDVRAVVGLKLSLPSGSADELRVSSTVTLGVSGVDEGGLVDPAWRPGSSLAISVLGDPGAIRSSVLLGGEVQVYLSRAVDRSRLTLVASYPGLSTATLAVAADVRSDSLYFTRSSYTLYPGGSPVTLSSPIGVDANGNVDLDYLSPPASGRLENPEDGGTISALVLSNVLDVALSGTEADDRAIVAFRFVDTSNPAAELASDELLAMVDVLATRLGLTLLDLDIGDVAVVGEEFRITGQLQDEYGNQDIDTAYTLSLLSLLSVSANTAVAHRVSYGVLRRHRLLARDADRGPRREHTELVGVGSRSGRPDRPERQCRRRPPRLAAAGRGADRGVGERCGAARGSLWQYRCRPRCQRGRKAAATCRSVGR